MGNLIFGLTALLVLVTDQLTKLWISSILYPGQVLWSFSFINITLVRNTGAAFGIFPDQFLPLVIIRSLGAVLIIALVIFFGQRIQKWGGILVMLTLGLVLGGTLGNLIDQLRFHYVVDFVDFTYWPVFNVADSSVVISMFLLAYLLLWPRKGKSKS
jgi:signal peptidase II